MHANQVIGQNLKWSLQKIYEEIQNVVELVLQIQLSILLRCVLLMINNNNRQINNHYKLFGFMVYQVYVPGVANLLHYFITSLYFLKTALRIEIIFISLT